MRNCVVLAGLTAAAAMVSAQSGEITATAFTMPQIGERDGSVSVRLSGRRIAVLQPLERQLTLRAAEFLAEHLCQYKPQPDTRLVATLKGLRVVHSAEDGGVLEIIVEVPRQRPACEVRTGVNALAHRDGSSQDSQVQRGSPAGATRSPPSAGAPAAHGALSSPIPQVGTAPLVVIERRGEM